MDKIKYYIDSDAQLLVAPSRRIPDEDGVYLEFLVAEGIKAYDTLNFVEKPTTYIQKIPKDGLYFYYRLNIPKRSELELLDEETMEYDPNLKGKLYWDDKHYNYTKVEYDEVEFELDENGEKIIDTERITFKKDPVTGEYELRWQDVQDLDPLGQPKVDATGSPVMKHAYTFVSTVERTYKTKVVHKYRIEKEEVIDSEEVIYSCRVAGDNGRTYYKDYILGPEDDATHISLETLVSKLNNTDYGLLDHSFIVDENDLYIPNVDTLVPVPIFSTHYLDLCLESIEREALKDGCKVLSGDCSVKSNKTRDFLIISHFIIQRYIAEHDYVGAQEVIDFISSCGAPCANVSGSLDSAGGCGCGK